jgi:hypothetical protein
MDEQQAEVPEKITDLDDVIPESKEVKIADLEKQLESLQSQLVVAIQKGTDSEEIRWLTEERNEVKTELDSLKGKKTDGLEGGRRRSRRRGFKGSKKSKTRKGNKMLSSWVAFVKKVQHEEQISYSDAMKRASARKKEWKMGQMGGEYGSVMDPSLMTKSKSKSKSQYGGKKGRKTSTISTSSSSSSSSSGSSSGSSSSQDGGRRRRKQRRIVKKRGSKKRGSKKRGSRRSRR